MHRNFVLAGLVAFCLLGLLPLDSSAQISDEPPPAAAILKTDPELEYRLRRADELAAMGEYVLVIPLWQEALDASRDVMFTRDGQLYRPIGMEIEQTICSLPAQALRAYRLSADGQVAALLAEAQDQQQREEALAQIVQRYFLSTHGDEAAYELACRVLDRHDFVHATHLLRRILDDYPDSDVDPTALYLRLAVAQVELGARSDAAECMKLFHALRPDAAESSLSRTIAAQIEQVPATPTAQCEPGIWHMRLGTLAGDGAQAAPPASIIEDDLIELWHHDFRTGSSISASLSQSSEDLAPFRGLQDMPHIDLPRDGELRQLQDLSEWIAFREDSQFSDNQPFPITGHPNAQLLFDEGRVYFKTPAGLICTDAHTGRVLWQGLPSSYAADLNTELYNWLKTRGNNLPSPSESLRLYGDRVNHSMAISGGQIFTIEGDPEKHRIEVGENEGFEMMQSGVARTRYNYLTAYEAGSGKVLWRFPGGREFFHDDLPQDYPTQDSAPELAGGEEVAPQVPRAHLRNEQRHETPERYKLGFMGPPAPMARLVLAPVSQNGALWLYALDRREGTLVWKTFLCEELPNASDPWAPVGIAVEGGEVYVSTGSSAVLALDSRTGAVRWALHYDSIVPYTGLRGYYYGNYGYGGEENVWEENSLVVYGNALIVLASDSNRIQARDRRDGSLLWESPIAIGENTAAYCLGMLGDRLYVAGLNVIRCIAVTDGQGNPSNGRIVWEAAFDTRREGISFGRGIVTESGIFLPWNDEILYIAPESGEIIHRLALTKPSDIDPQGEIDYLPVGNLYSDGRWLHMASPGRISTWGTPQLRQEAWGLPETPADEEHSTPSEENITPNKNDTATPPATTEKSLPADADVEDIQGPLPPPAVKPGVTAPF